MVGNWNKKDQRLFFYYSFLEFNMSNAVCPKCGGVAQKGGFETWQIVVAILCFPLGLLALLGKKKPSKCNSCNIEWQ
jgi:hypothetical protein